MFWYRKGHSTPFEYTTINGIFILGGDILADTLGKEWVRDQRRLIIDSPSGFACELLPGFSRENRVLVPLFGEMNLALFSTLDEAYAQATVLADQYGYFAQIGDSQFIDVRLQTLLTYFRSDL
jgi:hypothetical protein